MQIETFQKPWGFELLDSGNGYRLEKWNEVILTRPDPQIIWKQSLPKSEWEKSWAIYKSGFDEKNSGWNIKKSIPKNWTIFWNEVKFLLKLSPFKHTGIFAEQATQWEWMIEKLKLKNQNEKYKILNLFAYTGGATMVLAKAGFQVTHVDASKPSITWANENHKLNNLPKESVRWILDDCVKFVKRELKRGIQYDGIIMDPPAFGHSPTGKTWKFNLDLPGLLSDCISLLSPNAKFLIINGYATNSSAIALNNLLEDEIKNKIKPTNWQIEFGELCLKHNVLNQKPNETKKNNRLLSTGIFARWSFT